MICSNCNGKRTVQLGTSNVWLRCCACVGFGSIENKEKYETRFKSLMAKAIIEVTMDKELRDLSDAWIDSRCTNRKHGKFLSYDECGECYECRTLTVIIEEILKTLKRQS